MSKPPENWGRKELDSGKPVTTKPPKLEVKKKKSRIRKLLEWAYLEKYKFRSNKIKLK